jgi:hypothetical protein
VTHAPLAAAAVQRRWLFGLEIGYLLFLLATVLALAAWHGWRVYIPDPIGPVPLIIPWFGAVGGVLTSLRGIVDHGRDWDTGYCLRHVARPLTAAVSGTVGYLILLGGVVAVGQTPTFDSHSTRADVVYDVTAFVIGYREEVFRTLLARVVDRLLGKAAA